MGVETPGAGDSFDPAPGPESGAKSPNFSIASPRICPTPGVMLVPIIPSMIRRSFFQTLAAVMLPPPVLATAKPAPAACGLPAQASHPSAPERDPDWLREWREMPKREVCVHDLPFHCDPRRRDFASAILYSITEGTPLTFRYHGGSEPGAARTVLPTLLFRPERSSFPEFRSGDPAGFSALHETPIYLLGWCQTRHAARTFRLDRMEPRHTDQA